MLKITKEILKGVKKHKEIYNLCKKFNEKVDEYTKTDASEKGKVIFVIRQLEGLANHILGHLSFNKSEQFNTLKDHLNDVKFQLKNDTYRLTQHDHQTVEQILVSYLAQCYAETASVEELNGASSSKKASSKLRQSGKVSHERASSIVNVVTRSVGDIELAKLGSVPISHSSSSNLTLDTSMVPPVRVASLSPRSKLNLLLGANASKEKLLSFITGYERSLDKLIAAYVAQNNHDILKMIGPLVIELNDILQNDQIKKILAEKKLSEILSAKNDTDYCHFENAISDIRGSVVGDRKSAFIKAFADFLGVSELDVAIDGLSFNNNYVYKITYQDTTLVFVRAEQNEKNEAAVEQLQNGSVKKYIPHKLYKHTFGDKFNGCYTYELMPFYDQGNYENIAVDVIKDPNIPVDKKQKTIFSMFSQISDMLLKLRKYDVIYTDLKPSNIVKTSINDKESIVIADIKSLSPHQYKAGEPLAWDHILFTELYRPPEQKPDFKVQPNPYKTDVCADLDQQQVYVLAICLYQMLLGKTAEEMIALVPNNGVCYSDVNPDTAIAADRSAEKCILAFDDEKFSDALGQIAKILIQAMVHPLQERRPSLAHVSKIVNFCLNASEVDLVELTRCDSFAEINQLCAIKLYEMNSDSSSSFPTISSDSDNDLLAYIDLNGSNSSSSSSDLFAIEKTDDITDVVSCSSDNQVTSLVTEEREPVPFIDFERNRNEADDHTIEIHGKQRATLFANTGEQRARLVRQNGVMSLLNKLDINKSISPIDSSCTISSSNSI